MGRVTRDDIVEIAGNLDEGRILQILKTEANREELLEAFTWLSADDAMARDRHRAPHGRVAELLEILERPDTALDEAEEP